MNLKYLLVIPAIILIGIMAMNTGKNVMTVETGTEAVADGLTWNAKVCTWKNGELISCSHNVLTNTGKELIEAVLGNTGSGGPVQYIALSDNATHVPSATDTTLVNEITSGGLERALGTYTSVGTGEWHISN